MLNELKTLKLRILDDWNEDSEENFNNHFLVKMLRQKYKVVYSDNPDFIIYSINGYRHLEYDCVRIFITGENVRTDWNIADYGIDFDFLDFGDRHLRIPLEFLVNDEWKKDGMNRTINFAEKNKFCGIMIGNGGFSKATIFREKLFEELSKYKKVDSGGTWNNNIGRVIGDRYKNFRYSKIEWLKEYKFNICCENSSYPGYLTEKIFDAYYAGCVPIYWGDTSLRHGLKQENNTGGVVSPIVAEYSKIDTQIPNISSHLIEYKLNPKAFINAHNFSTLTELIDEIKRLDNDDCAFQSMLQEPLFLNNFNPFLYYQNKLFNFLESIFSQNPQEALRRGSGQWLESCFNKNLSYKLMQECKIKPSFFRRWKYLLKFL